MSNTNNVTLAAIHRFDLGVILCKTCNEVIATLPTDGYKKFYVSCNSITCMEKNKEANK